MHTKVILNLAVICFVLATSVVSAQNVSSVASSSLMDQSWKQVATQMPDAWYGSDEAKAVAENVLLCQKEIGGWAKNKPYHHELTADEKAQYIQSKTEEGATFDNGATIMELKFLAHVYAHIKDSRYQQAFEKGIHYIFIAQYENGGWPQFYPFRKDKSVAYAADITYNDNAMVNIMLFLRDLFTNNKDYTALDISNAEKNQAKQAFDRGVDCILKTQIVVDGQPTVWCAQHDAVTLVPSKARKYELPSYSGSESVGIVQLLMDIDHPSAKIIASVNGAIKWFENHQIEGIRLDTEIDSEGQNNRIVVQDANAPAIWARFYDLETGKPFFCDRDGIKKNSLAEIGHERRNGYGWYTDAPSKILAKYPKWCKTWQVK